MTTPMMRTRTTAVATALLIASLSLVGCSGGGGDAAPRSSPAETDPAETDTGTGVDQTTAEACAELQSSIQGLQDKLQSSFTELQSDPTAASAAITELSDTFSAGVDRLRNEEVAAAAEPADAALSELATTLQAYVADPAGADPQALTAIAGSLQESFTGLGETCS